jgi:hypothetical protein
VLAVEQAANSSAPLRLAASSRRGRELPGMALIAGSILRANFGAVKEGRTFLTLSNKAAQSSHQSAAFQKLVSGAGLGATLWR